MTLVDLDLYACADGARGGGRNGDTSRGGFWFLKRLPPPRDAAGALRSPRDLLRIWTVEALNAAFCGFYRAHRGAAAPRSAFGAAPRARRAAPPLRRHERRVRQVCAAGRVRLQPGVDARRVRARATCGARDRRLVAEALGPAHAYGPLARSPTRAPPTAGTRTTAAAPPPAAAPRARRRARLRPALLLLRRAPAGTWRCRSFRTRASAPTPRRRRRRRRRAAPPPGVVGSPSLAPRSAASGSRGRSASASRAATRAATRGCEEDRARRARRLLARAGAARAGGGRAGGARVRRGAGRPAGRHHDERPRRPDELPSPSPCQPSARRASGSSARCGRPTSRRRRRRRRRRPPARRAASAARAATSSSPSRPEVETEGGDAGGGGGDWTRRRCSSSSAARWACPPGRLRAARRRRLPARRRAADAAVRALRPRLPLRAVELDDADWTCSDAEGYELHSHSLERRV